MLTSVLAFAQMMTLGRDVSGFFADVVKNISVDSLEIKKLVYQFISHYAEQNQDLALLSVNSLQKDSRSQNQRVRANAIRAMAGIKVRGCAICFCLKPRAFLLCMTSCRLAVTV